MQVAGVAGHEERHDLARAARQDLVAADPAFQHDEKTRTTRIVDCVERREFSPGDVEIIHAVFAGGINMPATVRVFVDFLAMQLWAA